MELRGIDCCDREALVESRTRYCLISSNSAGLSADQGSKKGSSRCFGVSLENPAFDIMLAKDRRELRWDSLDVGGRMQMVEVDDIYVAAFAEIGGPFCNGARMKARHSQGAFGGGSIQQREDGSGPVLDSDDMIAEGCQGGNAFARIFLAETQQGQFMVAADLAHQLVERHPTTVVGRPGELRRDLQNMHDLVGGTRSPSLLLACRGGNFCQWRRFQSSGRTASSAAMTASCVKGLVR